MAAMTFYVNAHWDDEASVFYSESNIAGLHIEASTIEEFVKLMREIAPVLVLENHVTKKDMATRSWTDMIPSIFFEKPTESAAVA